MDRKRRVCRVGMVLVFSMLAAVAAAAPVATVAPATKDFANVEVDTSQVFKQTFTVQNTGGEDLVVGQLAITGADAGSFSILNDTVSNATLAASASATVDVQFDPATPKAKAAALSIPSNITTIDVPLAGNGIVTSVAGMNNDGRIFAAYSYLDGTFGGFRDIGVDIGQYCRAIAIDDFDNDGDNDILAGAGNGNQAAGPYYYFQNNGDGTFTSKGNVFTIRKEGEWLMDIAAGDFNNDGKMDAIVNGHVRGNSIYFGNGNGTFTYGNFIGSNDTRGTDAADFDHDGNLDFARARYGEAYIIGFQGDGTGRFDTQTLVGDAGLVDPYGLVAGDFDNDGHADLISSAEDGGPTNFHKGKGDGTFFSGTTCASLSTTDWRAYDAFDYNQDGNLDILMYRHNAQEMLWQPGNGNGTFGTAVKISTFGLGSGLTCAAPFMTAGYGAPIAALSQSDTTVPVGGSVDLDASASTDANGTIASYEWDFGDGEVGSGVTVDHAYVTEGIRNGMLKVTDDTGRIDYRRFSVEVTGTPPAAEANGPYTFGEEVLSNGEWTATLDGTGSADAESPVTLSWDFGDSFSDDFEDGTMDGWTVYSGSWAEADGMLQHTSTSGDHVRTLFTGGQELADFTVECDVTYLSGSQHLYLLFRAQDSANFYAFLLRGAGYDDFHVQRWINGSSSTLGNSGLGFTVVNNKTYHYKVVCTGIRIDCSIDGTHIWGGYDPQFAAGFVGFNVYRSQVKVDNLVVTSTPGTGSHPVHVYRKGPGTYPVTLTVTDAAGQTGTDTTTVTLGYNDPPLADVGGPYSADESAAIAGRWPVQLDGSGSSDDVEIVQYDWAVEQDDFTADTLNSRWLTGGAGVTLADGAATLAGSSNWGQRYLFSRNGIVSSECGATMQAKIKVTGGVDVLLGFKNNSTNYHYNQMAYGIDFYASNTSIYVNGSSVATTGHVLAPNVWYDVKIDTKPYAGAKFYFRPTGSSQWILLCNTDYWAGMPLLAGVTIGPGSIIIDDYKLVLHSQMPVAYYYDTGEYPLELTVTDRAGQTGTDSTTVTITKGEPPTAHAGPDILRTEAHVINSTWTVVLDGSWSTDDYGIYMYEWNFGDGTAVSSWPAVGHTYTAPGVYTATLTVWDNANQMAVDTATVTIITGEPPVAEAGPDVALGEADTVNGMWKLMLDGSGSTDDWGIVKYEWDFGDATAKALGKVVEHTFMLPGTYTVTLKVWDDCGQTSTDTMTVTITPGSAPVADAGGPYVVQEADVAAGQAYVLFDGSSSADDNGILHYMWDFGTETFDTVTMDMNLWAPSYQVFSSLYGNSNCVTIWGEGEWGGKFIFTKYRVPKRPGLIAQASLTGSGSTMFGFKHGGNTTYSYTDMPYAIYLYDGNLYIYEDGNNRGDTGYDFTQNQWYDYRIVLNDLNGADYYYKTPSAQTWTLIYRSSYSSGSMLRAGMVVNNAAYNMDNFRLMASGKTVTFPVRKEGTVTLTVEDQAHQTHSVTVPIAVEGSEPPAANPGGPYFTTFDLPTLYDGTGSADDNGIVKYVWDFDDGLALRTGPQPVHKYLVGSNTGAITKTIKLTVWDAGGQSDTKTTTVTIAPGPLVTCVPWQFTGGVEVPHHTWTGKSVRLKGVVRGGIGTLTWRWSFGDGTADATGTVSNKYAIEASHTYTGTPGAQSTATLTVTDSKGNAHSDTYPIEILPYSLDTRMDVAIDEGLWWLHKSQVRYDPMTAWEDGRWGSYSNNYGSVTGGVVQAFLINGHKETGDDAEDPYAETIRRGVKFLMNNMRVRGIGNQTYGNPDYPYNGTGNGIGLSTWAGNEPYELGQVMDGIVATHDPDRIAYAGCVQVAGRAYQSIMQDMMDCYSWGQSDDTGSVGGGWRYNWHQNPDNSACQWAAIGMIPASQAPWYCIIPEWVRSRNNVWLSYSYNSGSKWFGYESTGAGNNSSQACRPSGMVQMVMSVNNYKSDNRWIGTEGWFANTSNWNWFIGSRSQYAWYAFVKAMRLSRTEALSNGFNWFRGTNGIAERLLAEQESDGTWPAGGQATHPGDYGDAFVTSWGVIMLTPTLFVLPPVADAGGDAIWAPDRALNFDGSASYHLNPDRTIELYEWDFDGNGTYDYAGTSPTATHTYAYDDSIEYPKTYVAVLRVTDNEGETDTDTRQVIIKFPPHPPIAVITGPRIVLRSGWATAGLPTTLDGTDSFDINDSDTITRYEWDFDGSNGYDFENPESTEPTVQKTWASPGSVTVALRVWDSGVGNEPDFEPLPSEPAYLQIRIEANRTPVADAGGPYTTTEGVPVALHGTAVDPNLARDPLTTEWDLDNDGEFDDAADLEPEFMRADVGVYVVKLRVSDGLLSSVSETTVTVLDGAPAAEFTWQGTYPGGGDVSWIVAENAPVNFTDRSTTPFDAIVAWAWDFAGLGTSSVQNPSFIFPDDGTFDVTLTVTDTDGSSDSVTHQVAVQPLGPTAKNDAAIVQPNNAPNAINVLANDTYLPGAVETLTIIAATDGAHGTVAITGGGAGLTYKPASRYKGTDEFTYTIRDEDGLTSTATVNVTVRLEGDANRDCNVNVLDMIFVRNRLNQPIGTGDNWKADVNGDGKINVLDMIYTRNHLNAKCL